MPGNRQEHSGGDAVSVRTAYDAYLETLTRKNSIARSSSFSLYGDIKGCAKKWVTNAVGNSGFSREQARQCVEQAEDDIHGAIKVCESPIERAMLPFLVFQSYLHDCPEPARIYLNGTMDLCPACSVVIVPQFAFVKYRLDFAIVAKVGHARVTVALECDGREFHEAQRDAKRDAFLASWGIPTVRAKGTDVARDAALVSQKVSELVYAGAAA
jgi:hypothetical protein